MLCDKTAIPHPFSCSSGSSPSKQIHSPAPLTSDMCVLNQGLEQSPVSIKIFQTVVQ